MARWRRHFWEVEDCATVTATEAVGHLRGEPSMASGVVWLAGRPVRYMATSCPYGGGRFWLLCPGCERRAFKLYAPPPYTDVACRVCHDLTYWSRRQGPNWLRPLYRGVRAELELAALRHRRGRRPKRFYRLLRAYEAGTEVYRAWRQREGHRDRPIGGGVEELERLIRAGEEHQGRAR